jgi:arylsulfatase A-like enzyme/tetratricopeptide (TPR) repeat protein
MSKAYATPGPAKPAGEAAPRRHSRRSLRAAAGVVLVAAAVGAGWAGWGLYGRLRHGGIRHVVLISIDTCRADRLSCYGYPQPTTPAIDAVARDGALFKSAMTPVPMTTPAHSSILTGTYPPAHGVRLNNGERLAESNLTLAEILRDAGYRTAAFVGAFPLDADFGLNQGFDTYDGQFARKDGKAECSSERTGEEVNRPALAWLEGHAAEPFFLFLHYFDPHAPYAPPPPYDAAHPQDPYAGEVAYVDHCIGQVLDRLRAVGAYEDTLLIIVGDHGESLGEHGENTHALLAYQSALHVPLVIRTPRGGKGLRVAGNVSLVDIVPTVLDLVGQPIPAGVQGVSLRRALRRLPQPGEGDSAPGRKEPVYFESLAAATFGCGPLHGVVEGPWKYIRAPRQELYDLARDPGELNNVFEGEPQVAQRLRGRLEQMLLEMESAGSNRGRSPVDPEAARKLQSLGYVGGGVAPPPAAFDPNLEDPKEFLPTYERIQKSEGLLQANRSEEAKKELLDIIKGRPQLITAQAMLAQIALREHQLADVAARCEAIVSILAESKVASSPRAPGGEEFSAGKLDTRDLATAHFNLGTVLKEMGKPREAAAQYEQALQIRPDSAEVLFNLGVVLAQAGKMLEAVGHYEQALRIKPDYADAHFNLALVLAQSGRVSEAVGHYVEALRLNADWPVALNNLAWIRATSDDPQLRDGAEAVRLAERACQLTGRKQFPPLDTLAAAYAQSGRFPEAVAAAQEAIALARAAAQLDAAALIESHLAAYRAAKPYREPPAAARE